MDKAIAAKKHASKGRFLKGAPSPNPRGRPRGRTVENHNAKLLKAAKHFKGPNGESWEQCLLTTALVQAAKGQPSLAVAVLSKMYINLTPESTGISLAVHQNNAPTKTENKVVNLGEHLGDAGTRELVAGLVNRLASRQSIPGGNGDVHQ